MLTVGASHRTTPIAALGAMSAAAHDLKRRLREGGPSSLDLPVEELAVLATCGRVEVYAVPRATQSRAVSEVIAREVFDAAPPAVLPSVDPTRAPYLLEGDHVVRHLCRVAAGLDSMVPGEHEISGQVARAFEDVVRPEGRGSVLSTVAALARKAGSRVRAETSLGRHAASVGFAAVEIVCERLGWHEPGREPLGGPAPRSVVVLGTGPAGVSVGRALRSAHVGALTFVSRDPGRGHETLRSLGARVEALGRLGPLLRGADAVFTASGADGFLIDATMAQEAARARGGRRLLIVDLAVPADVDPAVAGVPGVELLGLDDVRERVGRHVSRRLEDLAPAEAVIDDVVGGYDGAARRTESLIDELRRAVEEVRAREVSRWLDARNGSGAPTREELDRLTRSLVNKLLHDPMIRLRAAAPDVEGGRALLDSASELFGLSAGTARPAPESTG